MNIVEEMQSTVTLNDKDRDISKIKKVNLGCGNRPILEMINVDSDPKCNPDILHDLNTKLPFDDDSIEGVYTSHVIEHVEDIFAYMYEIWRICKDGAEVHIIAPHYIDWYSSIQPSHKRFIRPAYFETWDPAFVSRFPSTSMNYETDTKGAEFTQLNEGFMNEQRELFFVLKVIKKEVKKVKFHGN